MDSKYFTVVFKVIDKEQFKNSIDDFIGSMSDDTELNGAIVTALGWGDVMSKAEKMEEALMNEGLDDLIPDED